MGARGERGRASRRRGAGLMVVLAVGGGALVATTPVAAGSSRSFSATPTELGLGEVAVFTATGCADPLIDPEDLLVTISIGEGRASTGVARLTPDADGTATYVSPVVTSESMPGTYEFFAQCADMRTEEGEVLFVYDGPLTITVLCGAPATAPPPPTAPAPPPAGSAPAVSPRFTG
jgi:hypothetical protein